MKKLLKLQNDTVSIKVTNYDYPAVLVYGDKFYERIEFTGNIEKVTSVLSGYITTVLQEMRRQKKQFLRIKFDFCEEDYKELMNCGQPGVQKELFKD